jgi:small subunit ribosomal protein S1
MSNDRNNSDGENFASLFDATRRDTGRRGPPIVVGEKREVTIIKIGRDAVFVSLDGKHEGFIERTAFGEGAAQLREGMKVLARVVDAGAGRDGAPKLMPLAVRDEDGTVEAAPAASAEAAGPVIVEGLRVKGAVTRVERYGVFVQIAGTQGRSGRGLVPAAELGAPRNADLRKLFPVGAALEAKVVRIDEDGKIRLSVTALRDDEEQAAFREHRKQASADAAAPAPAPGGRPAPKPAPRNFGTLGDLMAARRKPGG